MIELDPKQAPKTGGLVRRRWPERASTTASASTASLPGFVIQGGDPTGNGTGGPGYKIRERPPDDVVYSEGVVAMAKGGDGAAGHLGQPVLRRDGRGRGPAGPTMRCSAR